MKIDHHRGPVTSVKVTSAGDVLVSGSHDGNVCIWSLDSFSLLNTISLQLPIQMIDVSSDSVFLLACCTDNNLYLRTLATGTELHCLSEHKSKVTTVLLLDRNRVVRIMASGSNDGTKPNFCSIYNKIL